MIGVMTRSKSCSGTCLNFKTARQPKTSALESAEGAAGRSTVDATPAATSRCPQLRQKDSPAWFSVPQRGHWVLSPVALSAAGTTWAAAAVAATSSDGGVTALAG